MSLRFLNGTDHHGPMPVSGSVFDAYTCSAAKTQKTETQTWDHISRLSMSLSLRPEDVASLEEDRSSQSSSDEYFSQTSDGTTHTSPLSESWSEQQSSQQSSDNAAQTEFLHDRSTIRESQQLSSLSSQTDSPCRNAAQTTRPTEQHASNKIGRRQDVVAAGQSFGGLVIDTTNVATDAMPSRMRPEPKYPVEERLSRRRNFAGPSCTVTPPKLKRDTDQTDAIVKMIVLFCTNLINSIWATNGTVPPSTASGGNVLPLQVFITETLRRSKTSYSTLQIALYYLILLKQALPQSGLARQASQGCRALQCGRRMFLTALILASKYLQDRNYSARAWSKISGLPLKEINENERRYLSIVCWNLHVPKCTFENWSKIVLGVCRMSIDAEAFGREQDIAASFSNPPPSPGSSSCPIKASCEATLSALQSWWSINLKSLCTDIVRCPRKTEQYVGAITPFRTTPTLPRLVRDEAWSWRNDLDRSDKCITRLPSIETMTKSFYNQDTNGSPLTTSKPPTQRLLANLPTPQQTPYANEMWTPQLSKCGVRSRPSASALASLDQRRCPMAANLDTCPPPIPANRFVGQAASAWTAYRQSVQNLPDRSTTSSPDSVISETSSVFSGPNFARSRSSSISSSMSWVGPDVAALQGNDDSDKTSCRRILEDSHVLALQQPASRLNALSLNPVTSEQSSLDSTPTPSATRNANISFDTRKPAALPEQSLAELLAIRTHRQLLNSTQATPTAPYRQPSADMRPRLDKAKSQVFETEAVPLPLRSLKRSRTTSVDLAGDYTCRAQNAATPHNGQGSARSFSPIFSADASCTNLEKSIVHPNHSDKQPRKPVSCGDRLSKRTALTVSSPAYANQILRQDWYSAIAPRDIEIQG